MPYIVGLQAAHPSAVNTMNVIETTDGFLTFCGLVVAGTTAFSAYMAESLAEGILWAFPVIFSGVLLAGLVLFSRGSL